MSRNSLSLWFSSVAGSKADGSRLNLHRLLILLAIGMAGIVALGITGQADRVFAQAQQVMTYLVDTDNDGMNDAIDLDDDNDWIADITEGDGAVDTDGDGFPDSRDLDSDNDGILDKIEVRPYYATSNSVDWSETNCEFEPILQTNQEGTPIIFVTRNDSYDDLELFWIDHAGQRVSQGEVAGGQTITLTTYSEYPYLFAYLESGECAYVVTKMSGDADMIELPPEEEE